MFVIVYLPRPVTATVLLAHTQAEFVLVQEIRYLASCD